MATIGGYPLRKMLKNAYLSALLGATSGMTYSQLKHHPQKLKKVFVYSSVPGLTGLFLGSCYGYFNKRRMIFTSLKGAGNFFLMSCSYLGIKEALNVSEVVKNDLEITKGRAFVESTFSGTVTGFIVGSFWWKNPINFITTAASFGAIAATGQLIIDKLQQWRIKKAILLQYPELAELEWLVLDVEEQETVKQKNKSWWIRVYDKLLDKPQSGKLKDRQKLLIEELESLEKEESDLLDILGLKENDRVTQEDSR